MLLVKSIVFFILLNLNFVFAEDQPTTSGAYSGKQDQNWEVVQNELATLKTKMDAQSSQVQALVAQKSSLKGDDLTRMVNQIKVEHRQYEDLVLEYNKKNDEFLTRYPERGLKEKRIYSREKIKSLSRFEKEVSVKGRMKQVHQKVLKQYPRVTEKQRSSSAASAPSVLKNKQTKPKPPQDVTETIEFKK